MYSTNICKRIFTELTDKFKANNIDYPMALASYDPDYTGMEMLVSKTFELKILNFSFSNLYQEIMNEFVFNLETEQKHGLVENTPRLVFEVKHYESLSKVTLYIHASTKNAAT